MAAETEGIALLSMYGDDDDEEEAAVVPDEKEAAAVVPEEEEVAAVTPAEDDGGEDGYENPKDNYTKSNYPPQSFIYKSPQPIISPSPLRPRDDVDSKTLTSPFPQRTPTPQPPASRSQLSSPFNITSPSPPLAPMAPPPIHEHPDGQRPRRISLAIVDYAQDEAAMSPDAEVMEIGNNGRVVFAAEIHVSDGKVEGTPPVTSQSLTPNIQQEPLLPFDAHEQFKSEVSISMDFCGTELEADEVNASPIVSTDMQIDKQLQNFLPPIVTTKCSEELQEKINKFLAYKKAGKSFNADLRNRKDYRNPNFLQHAVSYQDIDESGTCFSKEVFDPHGYDKSDYYDEIEADMKRELERKEQERKKSQKIDFVSGGSQPGGVAPALKMNAPSPAAGVSTFLNSSLPPNSAIGDVSRDNRTNKKSKWDKVDGDAGSVLFGFFIQLNRLYMDTVQKLPTKSNTESNILRCSVVPRFKYLPISAPALSSRGAHKSVIQTSIDDTSLKSPWNTYSNGERSPKPIFDDSMNFGVATPLLKSLMTQVGSKFGESTSRWGSMLSDGQVGKLKDRSAAAMSTFGDMLPAPAAGLLSSFTSNT